MKANFGQIFITRLRVKFIVFLCALFAFSSAVFAEDTRILEAQVYEDENYTTYSIEKAAK